MNSAKYAREAIQDRVNLYNATSNISLSGVKPLRRKYTASAPITETPLTNSPSSILPCAPLETDGEGNFIHSTSGRKIILKGINLDAAMKLPTSPALPSFKGDCTDGDNVFFDGDNVTFVGRPFPLEEAQQHILRIKSWGYNTIRYLLTWEAIEHAGPGKYDDKFIDYTLKILKIIHEVGGVYVFLEFHQDVWSRFSGGSGAPLWTLYAAGLQPTRFAQTEAAILHNEPRFHREENPEEYIKMLWTSNYKRLAAMTMFTLFFAGKNYFPYLKINGVNIQDYLQDHFFNCTKHIWTAINRRLPQMIKDGTILGFESMNEPNCGLMGHAHLGELPASQQLRLGTTPTVYQAFKLGMGLPAKVDEYRISITGPQVYGTKIVDPKGARAWLLPEEALIVDKKYGWTRDPKWVLGTCIFANEGIWTWDEDVDLDLLPSLTEEERTNISIRKCHLEKPNFFNQASARHNLNGYPKTVDIQYFNHNNFIDFYLKLKTIVRAIAPNAFVLMQPPVLEIPPNVKDDVRKIVDSKTVYCPHYYDGMSLMFKTWNSKFNVDTLGIMRGKYINPVLGIVFGENAIRNCIKKQFMEIRKECDDNLGKIPTLMSETGMPFDMDDKRAYTNGKYYLQTAALDALSYALESSNMSHTYWCYSSSNCHEWGDRWNNEDFSFWSPDDRNLQFDEDNENASLFQRSQTSINYTRATIKSTIKLIRAKRLEYTAASLRRPRRASTRMSKTRSGQSDISQTDSIDSQPQYKDDEDESTDTASLISSTTENVQAKHNRKCYPSPDGVRAVSAVVRPYVVATKGEVLVSEFDIRSVKYAVSVEIDKEKSLNKPTVIFVPKWHFPFLNYGDIFLTSGYIKYNEELEYLEWYHQDDPDLVISEEEASASPEPGNSKETLIIKNNSGTLDVSKLNDDQGLFYNGELNCPIT
ncbi:family 5 glycoside hydrolase [Scheffersomyces coipomensis]|uniref:family 5 glycoside hydrolase n=1 Tax=Scheffersomyces coipomensis TaxID=1788519 RepID=UPI00315DF6B0